MITIKIVAFFLLLASLFSAASFGSAVSDDGDQKYSGFWFAVSLLLGLMSCTLLVAA